MSAAERTPPSSSSPCGSWSGPASRRAGDRLPTIPGEVRFTVEAIPYESGANGSEWHTGCLPARDVARHLRDVADRVERDWTAEAVERPGTWMRQSPTAGRFQQAKRTGGAFKSIRRDTWSARLAAWMRRL